MPSTNGISMLSPANEKMLIKAIVFRRRLHHNCKRLDPACHFSTTLVLKARDITFNTFRYCRGTVRTHATYADRLKSDGAHVFEDARMPCEVGAPL
jgi:hypothetical protein